MDLWRDTSRILKTDAPRPAALALSYPNDDGLLLNQLPKWVPDAATRKKILVDNPVRLYGFN